TWVDDNVVNPALGMIEGAANKAIDWLVDQAVNRIVGSKIMARLDALMQQGAQQLKPFLDFLDKLEKGDMVDAALDVLMDWVRDAGFGVAWDHAGGLVKKALEMLTGTLKTGGQALVTSLGSVPGAGGLLAGAATWVLDEVMKWLTSEATSKIGTAIKTFFTDTLKNARNEIKAALASGPNEVKGAALPSSVAKGMKQVAGAVNTLISKINGVFKKMMELVKSRVNLTKYRNMAQKLVAK
ncbi:MAG: hypothetical protein HYU43_05165, partial [Armatimonadetes bacterium]|nr:hypothetical protein [Armatimonadota bacterium]